MTKTSPLIRYCLVNDGDHDYVVPLARREEWYLLSASELEAGVPEWVTRIDGPHLLSFTDWAEGDGDVDTVYAQPPAPAVAPKVLKLEDLVGNHTLYGVDTPARDEAKLADWVRFQLGKTVYRAEEDPSDGYRSYMGELMETHDKVANRFKRGVKVVARMQTNDPILDIVHAKTDKVILSVGTRNADDYYPSWVAEFNPENA